MSIILGSAVLSGRLLPSVSLFFATRRRPNGG